MPTLLDVFRERGVEVRGTARVGSVDGVLPLDRPLGHEWASEPDRVATVTLDVVDGLDEAVRIANEETSGLAAGIVTEDAAAAKRFLDGYRGTAAFWNATTRFTDGFELTGAPETGINVDWAPGPRGPVTYRDLCIRQYRVVGDGTQRVTHRRQARARASSRTSAGGSGAACSRAAPPRSGARPRRRARLRRLLGGDRARAAAARAREAAARRLPQLQAASALGQARLQLAWEAALRGAGPRGGADPALGRRPRRPGELRQRAQRARRRCSGSASSRS